MACADGRKKMVVVRSVPAGIWAMARRQRSAAIVVVSAVTALPRLAGQCFHATATGAAVAAYGFHQTGDFGGGMGSAFRQFAYFVRHYPDSEAQETLVNLLRMRYVEPHQFRCHCPRCTSGAVVCADLSATVIGIWADHLVLMRARALLNGGAGS